MNKYVFLGFVLLATKLFNHIVFQILGLAGFLLIWYGLWINKKSAFAKKASYAALGLFILAAVEFIPFPIQGNYTFAFFYAFIKLILYLVIYWVLYDSLFNEIATQYKKKYMVNEANLSMKKKRIYTNILIYATIFQNSAFMFKSLGAIIFLIGTAMIIYLSIAQVVYFYKVLKKVGL
ncbi:MAG: hypothetical protein ACI4U3_08890 [Traorella sp.]